MAGHVVIIEDEKDTLDALVQLFELHNYKVSGFSSSHEFLGAQLEPTTFLYLIDWNLPGLPGTEIVKMIRAKDKTSPIFMMSANNRQEQVLEALKYGADHYFKKPFCMDELLMRLNNAYFKVDHFKETLINIGVKLLPEASTVIKDGIPLPLTEREFKIFQQLYLTDGPLSREELLKCFDPEMQKSSRNIDVHIFSLRKKLAQVKMAINTVWGVGYKLDRL